MNVGKEEAVLLGLSLLASMSEWLYAPVSWWGESKGEWAGSHGGYMRRAWCKQIRILTPCFTALTV